MTGQALSLIEKEALSLTGLQALRDLYYKSIHITILPLFWEQQDEPTNNR